MKLELKPRRWYSSSEAVPEPGERIHHQAITLRYSARVVPAELRERRAVASPARTAPRRRTTQPIADVA